MSAPTRVIRHRGGVPVYSYRRDLDTPPVTVLRTQLADGVEHGRHIHDFPALWYAHATGLVIVAAPGEVIDPAAAGDLDGGVALFFSPDALGERAGSPRPAWGSHPLLFPFLHGKSGGLLRLEVPSAGRSLWDNHIRAIEAELAERRLGYQQAALAHLTLLLIDLARLADDVVGDLRRSGEPLLADVFAVIDRRYGEPLSLRDVAAEIGISPGHLTTVVRRRTGRTVQDWIIERRLAAARKLLADTDLPVAEIARRVGIADPGYFTRLFGRAHGVSPRAWRQRVEA
ncbi:helix-turn-helix transcriptional regulator [Mycobacterium sp. Marseille-P9652]|uniref:helix-turn-helix transcriptional regulator n=1 Tax=Mycobacterium sp. Marseille-P9652 TaxID=2654950 RepID=UPI0012E7F464|nr:AraC family transcriptional regulator [Mycobacterium sp. Marseille-P9652]